jgi:transcriptional regulator with XRE-family HTH domain
MAYPAYVREKARELRREKRLTIDELAERLAIPRTTIFGWVRDLDIPRKPNTGWPSAAQKKGTASMQARYRVKRELAYKQGRDEFRILCAQPTDQDPKELCTFWGNLLDVEPSSIKFQRKSNSGKLSGRTWRSRYGVLQVRVDDTYLRARLDARMDRIRFEWA